MAEYTVSDLVITQDNQVRPFDVDGSGGGGLRLLRDAYGANRAREDILRFLGQLEAIANRKTILYIAHSKSGMSPDGVSPEIITAFQEYYPQSSWVQEMHERSRREKASFEYKEQEMLAKEARKQGIKLVFCDEVARRRGKYHVSNMRDNYRDDGHDATVSSSEIGLLFRREYTHDFEIGSKYRNFDFPVINSPTFDSMLNEKIFLRELMRGTDFFSLFPRYLFVGMGLSTKQRIREFLPTIEKHSINPQYVLKPVTGSRGIGVEFPTREELERRFELAQPEPKYDYGRLLKSARSLSVPITLRNILDTPKSDLFNLFQLSTEAQRQKLEQEGGLDEVVVNRIPPVSPVLSLSSILEEYVHTQPTIVNGKPHHGYIRAIFFGDRLVSAIHRLPKEPYTGKFIDLTKYDVKTFWHGVDDRTRRRIEDTMVPMFQCFESKLEQLIETQTLQALKVSILKNLLRRARDSLTK